MQQSGHHFQPLAPKQQETNVFKSVSSHKCLTNSKLDSSAHTNVSLSSNGRESYPHLVSHQCLIKLHAAKRPSLSTSRSKATGNKFPSKSLERQFKSVSSHKCLTNSKLNLSAHTNVSLSSKGRESHPHLVSRKCLTKSLSSMQRSGHHHIEAQDRRDGKQSSDSQTHP